MTRVTDRYGSRAKTAAIFLLAGVLSLAGAAPALAQGGGGDSGGDAEIDVEWHADNKGFNVTSSKEISNVIVELCPRGDQRQAHKHQGGFDGKNWTHREDEVIKAIWVKSGDNHDPTQPQPPEPFNNPGAGEYFENPDAVCEPQPCEGPENIDAFPEHEANAVNWSTVEDADNYTLYRSHEGGPFEEIAVTEDTQFTDENVTVGDSYTYRVTATIDNEETAYCDQATVTAIPDLGTVFAVGMASLTGIAGYATYRRRS